MEETLTAWFAPAAAMFEEQQFEELPIGTEVQVQVRVAAWCGSLD
jgi:hypothetical protein